MDLTLIFDRLSAVGTIKTQEGNDERTFSFMPIVEARGWDVVFNKKYVATLIPTDLRRVVSR